MPRRASRRDAGELALRVRGLRGGRVRDLDLDMRAGEVVGVSGILGSGREHVAALLFGALPRRGGEVAVGGVALAPATRAPRSRPASRTSRPTATPTAR